MSCNIHRGNLKTKARGLGKKISGYLKSDNAKRTFKKAGIFGGIIIICLGTAKAPALFANILSERGFKSVNEFNKDDAEMQSTSLINPVLESYYNFSYDEPNGADVSYDIFINIPDAKEDFYEKFRDRLTFEVYADIDGNKTLVGTANLGGAVNSSYTGQHFAVVYIDGKEIAETPEIDTKISSSMAGSMPEEEVENLDDAKKCLETSFLLSYDISNGKDMSYDLGIGLLGAQDDFYDKYFNRVSYEVYADYDGTKTLVGKACLGAAVNTNYCGPHYAVVYLDGKEITKTDITDTKYSSNMAGFLPGESFDTLNEVAYKYSFNENDQTYSFSVDVDQLLEQYQIGNDGLSCELLRDDEIMGAGQPIDYIFNFKEDGKYSIIIYRNANMLCRTCYLDTKALKEVPAYEINLDDNKVLKK